MGGQGSTFSRPSAAAAANQRTASAIKGGQNPSGSPVASGVSQSQKDAYTQFGQKMAAAPRQPEITRTPGDAEQLARMARAENGLIRDPVTGQMSQLAAQGTMNVIRNRAEHQGVDVEGIISQSGQFSPWGDGSYAATKPTAAETAMAEQVLRGVTPDYTATPARPQGADFYHNETTVKNKSGYSKAATKDRVKDRFASTMSVADAVKPGVYGHTYGYDPTGLPASSFRTTPMAPAPKGRTDYGTGRVPTAANVPQGAMSPDPNFGGFVGSSPNAPRADHVPGRFGGLRPDTGSGATKIGYEQSGPVSIPGGLAGTDSDYYSRMQTDDQLNKRNAEMGMRADGSFVMDVGDFTVNNPDMVDRYGNPYGGYSRNAKGKVFDPNDATAAQRRVNQALIDTSLRTGQPMTMFSGDDGRGLNHVGHATDMRITDPATGQPLEGVNLPTGPRMTAAGARTYDNFADDVFDTVYQNPDVYGSVGPGMRYGGDFTQGVPRDLMHYDTTPGGGFSRAQSQRHAAAVGRSGNTPGTGGYMTASAMTPTMMNTAPPAPSYELSSGGIYNGLKSIPGAISGLGRGLQTISEGISTPNSAFKGAAGMLASPNPIVRAGAQAVAGQVVGPQVREFARSTIQGLKDIGNPNNPRAQEAERERKASAGGSRANTAASVREAQNAEQQRGTTPSSPPSRSTGNPDRGKGGDRDGKKETVAQKAKRVGKKKIEDLAKPEPKPVDWSRYTNVMSKEQAMRKLLGEEWYA